MFPCLSFIESSKVFLTSAPTIAWLCSAAAAYSGLLIFTGCFITFPDPLFFLICFPVLLVTLITAWLTSPAEVLDYLLGRESRLNTSSSMWIH